MASLMLVNPRKRRKAKAKRRAPSIAKRAGSIAKRVTRRKYRRNPIGGSGSTSLVNQVKNAAIGAGGALAVDIAMSKIPFLAGQSGAMRSAAQGAVSLGIGMAVAKFGKNKSLGVKLAEGGLTVALHGVMRGAVSKAMPSLALAGGDLLGYENLAGDLLGYEMSGFEDYGDDTVGWLSPAPVSSGFDNGLDY